ncbi:MAG TPA: M28 family peptidase [Gemmatimonadaceae bacterium]|nr:M28 family peptidase [Gemmatimonadaceae bacterium]
MLYRILCLTGATAFAAAPVLAQGGQRPTQPVTISIKEAFEEQAHPPLPRKHAPQPTTAAITANDLMTRLFIFADDSMMGRETGTEGHVKATNYIAAQLKALGLKPAGEKGTYFQDLPVVLRKLDPSSTLTVDGRKFVAGKDFIATAPTGRNGAPPIGTIAPAPAVYNGTATDADAPLTADQITGKIVVTRVAAGGGAGGRGFGGRGAGGGGGGGFPGGRGAGNAFASAAAVISVVDSLSPQMVNNALNPSEKSVVFTGIPNIPAAPPTITITRVVAEALFGSAIDGLKRGATGKTLTPSIKFVEVAKPARNVIAIMPGADAVLKNEYVAIGAHSDHVGYAAAPADHDSVRLYNAVVRTQGLENRNPPAPTEEEQKLLHTLLDSLHKLNGIRMDSINNGADDDGSGSVTLLEIAEAFAKAPAKPKRSIIFVWHVAEEKGLWGSDYFSRFPTVPRDSIVAQLNMDMVGRGKAEDIPLGGMDFVQPVGWKRLSSELGTLAEKLNATKPTPFKYDLQYDAAFQANNIYCRSDHANYARFGIPIVYYTTGLHRDYHMVTDEPQYMDYPHMASVGQSLYDLGLSVANLDHRPKVDGNIPRDPYMPCVNNGVVPDSLKKIMQ